MFETPAQKLIIAANEGRIDDVRNALHAGVDADTVSYGVTSLHAAAREGHIEIVRLLLENGADPNFELDSHITPLHMAAAFGQTAIVKLLLENGADPTWSYTPLDAAKRHQPDNGELITLLENAAARTLSFADKESGRQKETRQK